MSSSNILDPTGTGTTVILNEIEGEYNADERPLEDFIRVIETGSIQHKGVSGISKNTKKIKANKQIVRYLMTQNNLFSPKNIKNSSNHYFKQIYLVLYNALYYSYQNYHVYLKFGSEELFQQVCILTYHLNEQLESSEKVKKMDDNSLKLFELMKKNSKYMKKFSIEMQDKNSDGVPYSKKYQELCENKKFLPQQNGKQQYYSQIIKQQQIQCVVVDLMKLILSLFDLMSRIGQEEFKFFEDMIFSYLKKFKAGSTNQGYVFFNYYKEILNSGEIHNRYKLLKEQLQKMSVLIQSYQDCFNLALNSDIELKTKDKETKENQNNKTKIIDVFAYVQCHSDNTNRRNQAVFEANSVSN